MFQVDDGIRKQENENHFGKLSVRYDFSETNKLVTNHVKYNLHFAQV